MNFKNWLISEMPISNFQRIGQTWDKGTQKPYYGYKKDDLSILTGERSVQKIKKQWEKTDKEFDMYFVRSREAMKQVEVGAVDEQWIKENLKIDIPINPNNITILFTNNTGAERIPMTAWMIAHRFGHAVQATGRRGKAIPAWEYFTRELAKGLKEILEGAYNHTPKRPTYSWLDIYDDPAFKVLVNKIGTMKSAREKKITRPAEFPHEIFAQYLLTGKVRFNPLPKQLVTRYAWGNPIAGPYGRDTENWQDYLDQIAELAESNCYYVLSACVGRIFVM